jgi:fumarate hydratase class II
MLEMNVYKPQLVFNLLNSIVLLRDAMSRFNEHLVQGLEPDHVRIDELLQRSLMLVTALSPVIGYDRAAEIAHHAHHNGLTLKQSALELGYVTEEEFDRIVDPSKMV